MAEVILGTVVATFGIKGEVKIHSNTDFAAYRYKKGNKVTLYSPAKKERVEVKIVTHRTFKNLDIVLFENFINPEMASKYIGYSVLIERNESEFEDGIYHYDDIWKCEVYYKDQLIGTVTDMINSTSNITLRIARTGKKDLLYPFVDKFIKEVDVANKKIYISPIPGMLDLWK